jgi:hypothetical protein
MTTTNRIVPPRTAAAECAASAKSISARIGTVLQLIHAQQDEQPDGYPTQVIGASPPAGRSSTDPDHVHLTSVEAAALRRDRANDREHLTIALNEALRQLRYVEKIMSNERYRPAKPAQCDAGIGRDGQVEWGNPRCANYPSAGRSTCDPCLHAEDVWRVAHGLERREREAAHHSVTQPRQAGRFAAA